MYDQAGLAVAGKLEVDGSQCSSSLDFMVLVFTG